MIYFDYAATTPLDRDAAEIYMKAATEYYGNSNSLHDIGSLASGLLDQCRKELAEAAGVDPNGLYFTSGGSEGNFLAIHALLSSVKEEKKHIITCIAEHSSIHGTLKRLEKVGFSVTYLPFTPSGLVDLEHLAASIRPETALVCIQHVNSEIGTIQPIEKIAELCKANHLLFHSDFVQSFGKIDLKKMASLPDSFSFSGHKIYGPKGIGGVYVNPQIAWKSFFPGTTHEKGFRPGTLNVPAIAAMTAAAQKITEKMEEKNHHDEILREKLFEELMPIREWTIFYQADQFSQLPSIVGLSVAGIEGQLLMLECSQSGFAISTGSACQVGMQTPSKTIQALGAGAEQAKEFIRISFGKDTSEEDVQKLGEKIVSIVKRRKQ